MYSPSYTYMCWTSVGINVLHMQHPVDPLPFTSSSSPFPYSSNRSVLRNRESYSVPAADAAILCGCVGSAAAAAAAPEPNDETDQRVQAGVSAWPELLALHTFVLRLRRIFLRIFLGFLRRRLDDCFIFVGCVRISCVRLGGLGL